VSELVAMRELDYMFIYRAPVLLADEKARSGWLGLRGEKLDQGIRLSDVRHAQFGDDQLMRGQVVYPPKLHIDEAVFSLG
jgi:diaminohydroxyphosphoribosylaminopyrimidine deaminase/5-amino-6-(5-phosphoribosylamino)uracil reductase